LQSQSLRFTHVLEGSDEDYDPVLAIAQDKYGFIWVTRQLGGLQRYDGRELKSYLHDANNLNSLANNYVEAIIIDKDNIFWLGTYGSGLDRFDPQTNTFTHFIHNKDDKSSLINNTINTLYADRAGNIWIGTNGGLDMLDKKNGKFTHYVNDPSIEKSLSYNEVRGIYEDRAGTIWVGCGRPFTNLGQRPEDGGLNRLDKATGTFTRYKHNEKDPTSIADNKVKAIFEDSKGNFWIGTMGDGLQIMDRTRGTFTHYYYDPKHPEKLSRPPQMYEEGKPADHISFITEDDNGGILIGAWAQGLNYFNPADSTVTHYGLIIKNGKIFSADSSTGLNDTKLWKFFRSREGIMWITTLNGRND